MAAYSNNIHPAYIYPGARILQADDIQMDQQIQDTYMPREYRCDAHCYGEGRSISRGGIDVSKDILETFIREVRLLARDLPTYAKQDIELFRIKVHGIKGSSSQLGKSVLSEAAEAMEIAAKTRDWAYIESHMQSFRWKILTTAEELEAEWKYSTEQAERGHSVEHGEREYRAEHAVREESRICEENQGVKKLFELLQAGFDGYCIKQIESSIYALEHAELTPSERELLAKAKEAYEELEYEAGSALFS